MLDSIDSLVAEAGGRAGLPDQGRALRAMYPHVADWQAVRDATDPDRTWRSDLALRTGSIAGGEG
jgi:hypothetical protein